MKTQNTIIKVHYDDVLFPKNASLGMRKQQKLSLFTSSSLTIDHFTKNPFLSFLPCLYRLYRIQYISLSISNQDWDFFPSILHTLHTLIFSAKSFYKQRLCILYVKTQFWCSRTHGFDCFSLNLNTHFDFILERYVIYCKYSVLEVVLDCMYMCIYLHL